MKAIYWRPLKIRRRALVAMALVSLCGLLAVERLPITEREHFALKMAAAERAQQAMHAIRDERVRRGHSFSRRFDPAQSGMLGVAMSPVTSIPADLEAKQTSVNPNIAAHVVDMLLECGVQPGDHVAVGLTGSYPALNVCAYAAMETLGVRPTIVTSVASSQFGANLPDFMWPDMEKLMYDAGMISFRSVAGSLGGFGDRADGMPDDAKALLLAAIERNDLPELRSRRLSEAIQQRMELYGQHAQKAPIVAYVNVGGGGASIRGKVGKTVYSPGLHTESLHDVESTDCVLTRFLDRQIPVIHLSEAKALATSLGLPIAPVARQPVGVGGALVQARYNRGLAIAVLAVLAIGLIRLVRPGAAGGLLVALRVRRPDGDSELVANVASEDRSLRLMV